MWPFGSSAYPEKSLRDVTGREFDYIVVGAGTAGCAVASRLSEDPDVSVLVLEKGAAHDTWASRVPLMSCDVDQAATGAVHRYAGPDPNCDDRALRYVSCEAVGGCSRINGMLYTRGMPAVYNQWEQMGNAGWSWADVEGCFAKIEGTGEAHPDAVPASVRPGQVQILQQDSPEFEVYDRIRQLAPKFGIPVRDDLNNASALPEGHFPYPLTIDSARRRHSALHSYLPREIAIEREARLVICTGVIGTRLELDAERNRVSGIYTKPTNRPVGSDAVPAPDALESSDEVFIKTRREVILCGGTICSPQLLQLSGIGPAALVERHGIKLKRDLPGVGAAFADHQAIPVGIEVPWDQTLQYLEKSPLHAIWHLLRYATTGGGWMGSSSTHEAIWLNSERLDPETWTLRAPESDPGRDPADPKNIPDFEIMLIPASGAPDAHPGKPLFTLYTCLLRPESRGTIEIQSLDARADPSIRPNLLSHPGDLAVARKALRFALHLAERFVETWQHPSTLYLAPRMEADRTWRDLSDGELDGFIRANIRSMYHLTSTCRMAPEADGGVVDVELRVHGFANLRVADASVFPTIPAVHTMAPTYMVAERCADFVKAAWAERPR